MLTNIKSIKPLKDRILVSNLKFSSRYLSSGIYLPSDNGKSSGIRPRWGKVFAVGPDQHDVAVGQYILIAHGRWTRGIKVMVNDELIVLRMIDNNDILLVSDEPQFDDTMSNAI